MLVERLGADDELLSGIRVRRYNTEKGRDRMAPGVHAAAHQHCLERLLGRLLSGEARPIVGRAVTGVPGEPKIRIGLMKPVGVPRGHAPL